MYGLVSVRQQNIQRSINKISAGSEACAQWDPTTTGCIWIAHGFNGAGGACAKDDTAFGAYEDASSGAEGDGTSGAEGDTTSGAEGNTTGGAEDDPTHGAYEEGTCSTYDDGTCSASEDGNDPCVGAENEASSCWGTTHRRDVEALCERTPRARPINTSPLSIERG